MTTIEIAYGNSIVFKDTNTVTWSKSRSQNCVVTVEANAKFNPCQILLTGMKMNVSCESVNPKDTICAAIAKLQCQIDSSDGSGTVTSVDAGDLNPLFTTAVANPTTDAVISFAAISQNANLFYASPDGVAGIPLFRPITLADLPPITIAEPNTQIVYGTGASVDSSPKFTYNVASDLLQMTYNGELMLNVDAPNELFEFGSHVAGGGYNMLLINDTTIILYLNGSIPVEITSSFANYTNPTQESGMSILNSEGSTTIVNSTLGSSAELKCFSSVTGEAYILIKDTNNTNSLALRFQELSSADPSPEYFAIRAANVVSANRTMILPDDNPVAGEVLAVTSYVANVITTEWANAGALIAEPNTQIVYGTGASVDSSPNFTYNVATNLLFQTNLTSSTVALSSADDHFEVFNSLISPPFDISSSIVSDAGGGSILLAVDADDGVIQTTASIFIESHIISAFGEANIQFLFDRGSPDQTSVFTVYVDRIELRSQDTTSEAYPLRFYEADTAAGSNYFAVKGQDDIITTRTMQWPDDDPTAGEVLSVTSYAANIITTEWASAGALISIGTIDSVAASANGAVISGTSIIMQSASGTVPGLVNITTQTFAGDKTFSASTVSMNKNGTQVLAVGTTSFVFRTTNGGANVQAQAMFDPDNSVSVAGSQGFAFETANGLVFTAANGTRRIARASIKLTNLTNTANSEAGDLIFLTQSGGTAVSQKFRISGLGNIVAGNEAALATNASDGFLYVPSCAGTPNGTPTAYTGKIAVVVDSTNDIMYIYSNGAWVALN